MISVRYALLAVISVTFLAIVIILKSVSSFGFHLFFYISLAVMVRFIIIVMKQRHIFTLFVFSFLFLVYAIAGFTLGIQQIGLRSWRVGLFDTISIENALFIIGLNLLLFCGVATLLLRNHSFDRSQLLTTAPPLLGQLIQLFYAIVGSALLIRVGMIGRDTVVESGGGGFTVGIAIILATLVVAATLASPDPTRLMKASALLAASGCLFAAMNGYRYLLIAVVLMLVGRYLLWTPAPLRAFVRLLLPGSVLFCLLVLVGAGRNLDYNAIELINALSTGQVQWSSVMELVGASEELLLFSFVSVIESPTNPSIQAYFDALLNVLPSAIISQFFETERVNDLIVATVTTDWFHETNLNLGAFFFAEAAVNLGPSGVYIATLILSLSCIAVDRMRKEKYYRFLIFLFLVSNTGNLAYYGVNTFLKLWLYAEFFALGLRMTWGVHGARKPAFSGASKLG